MNNFEYLNQQYVLQNIRLAIVLHSSLTFAYLLFYLFFTYVYSVYFTWHLLCMRKSFMWWDRKQVRQMNILLFWTLHFSVFGEIRKSKGKQDNFRL